MDLTSYLGKENCLWSSYRYIDSGRLEVSTICQNRESGFASVESQHESISSSAISKWLDSGTKGTQTQNELLKIRMVWVPRSSTEKLMHISEAHLATITAKFALQTALEASFTVYAGMQRILPSHDLDGNKDEKYCFCIHPKVVIVWSYNEEHRLIQGICFAGSLQIHRLRELLAIKWHDHSTVLPLACATMLSMEIDSAQENIKQQVRTVEVRTGYHNWMSRAEGNAAGDLALLSAQMSGAASKLASVSRKTSIVEQLLRSSRASQDLSATTSIPHNTDKDLRVLHNRIDMHKVDTCFIKQRIEIQLSALYNLIAQNDAIASQSVAKQSKVVAVASQRDSTSMKALAVVTIFFLPGQVVASIFAMPLFDWTAGQANATSNDKVVNSRFGVYWAVTVPLTAFTFIVAAMWFLVEQHRRKRSILVETNDEHPSHSEDTEIGMLLRRRSTAVTA